MEVTGQAVLKMITRTVWLNLLFVVRESTRNCLQLPRDSVDINMVINKVDVLEKGCDEKDLHGTG